MAQLYNTLANEAVSVKHSILSHSLDDSKAFQSLSRVKLPAATW
jgi:hypothetical protein